MKNPYITAIPECESVETIQFVRITASYEINTVKGDQC